MLPVTFWRLESDLVDVLVGVDGEDVNEAIVALLELLDVIIINDEDESVLVDEEDEPEVVAVDFEPEEEELAVAVLN